MIARRRALGLMSGAVIAAGVGRSVSVLAQSAAPSRIGWLQIQSRAESPGWLDEFRAALRGLGHVEQRTYVLEERYADGDVTRLGSLAAELVRRDMRLIVATSQPAVDACRAATGKLPIIGRMTDDPVETGAAASLASPGGNVTGIYSLLEEMSGKRLAILQQAVPSLRRVGALLTPERGATARWLAVTQSTAQSLGVELHVMDVRSAGDLDQKFARAAAAGVDGVIGLRNPTIVTHARKVIELAAQHRLPSIFDAREYAAAGALLSYGPSLNAIFRRAADYAHRILAGASAAELPIEQPTHFELVINQKTARDFAIDIPTSLLASADEVIE